jgi:hypothetical protein
MTSRTAGKLLGASCVSFLIACSGTDGLVGSPDPGAPARLTFADVGFAGGQGLRTTITIDSAGSSYTFITCTESAGVTCDQTREERSGSTPVQLREQLFARTASGDFRRLKNSYRRASATIPPDPYDAVLTITANERTRTITWEKGAIVPALLTSFVCHLRAAAGELITCQPL